MIREPLKIALLATVVEFGGAERVVLSLLENINRDAIQIVPIIYTRGGGDKNQFTLQLEQMGLPYYRLIVDNCNYRWLNPVINLFATYRILKISHFDLIHSNGYRADVIGALCSKMTGVPFISTCHGFIQQTTHLRVYNAVDKAVLRYCSMVMAVSEAIKDALIKSGIKANRIVVIKNAVSVPSDTVALSKQRKEKRALTEIEKGEIMLGYVGRLSAEKGIRFLIEALSLLIEDGVPARLLIVGDGEERNALEELTEQLHLSSKVIFTGFQSDAFDWFPSMDVFVLPSLTEGTPMALLEAMGCGLPVVATAVGGVPQVIEDGWNGLLIVPEKPEEISRAVGDLYRDPELKSNLSVRARDTIRQKYNVSAWIKTIEEEYLRLSNVNR